MEDRKTIVEYPLNTAFAVVGRNTALLFMSSNSWGAGTKNNKTKGDKNDKTKSNKRV